MLNELETTNVIASISQPRFHTYMKAFSQIVPSETTSSEYRKVLFYFHIQNIYSCFYVPIQTLEITIRNQVHTQMSLFYSSEYWFNYLTSEAFCTKTSQDIISAAKRKTSSDFAFFTVKPSFQSRIMVKFVDRIPFYIQFVNIFCLILSYFVNNCGNKKPARRDRF